MLPPMFPFAQSHRLGSVSNRDLAESVQVVIPALDEEATLGGVVRELRQRGFARIRVVDNGSRDRTCAVAEEAGAEVLREPVPGYGRACRRGYENLPAEVEWVLFCDADGSDRLEWVEELLRWACEADFVLGNRRALPEARQAMTAVQNFGNGLATTLIRFGWGFRYRDLGPLRLIRRSLLEAIDMRDRGFGWTLEMQVRALEAGARVVEIPVGYRRRQGGRSKISGTVRGSFQAGSVILFTLGRLWLTRSRRTDLPEEGAGRRGRSGGVVLALAAALLLGGAALMAPFGNFLQPGNVLPFLAGAALASAGFFLALRLPRIRPLAFWGVLAGCRLLLLPMEPGDDIWRYMWEGRIQHQGFSPYVHPPASEALVPLRTDVWGRINHPEASAVYPPLAQFGFYVLTAAGESVGLFKLAFLLPDLLFCALLARRFGSAAALVYAWNPLVFYTIAGGAHYDSWFLLPLAAGWLWWEAAAGGGPTEAGRARPAAPALGMAAALVGVSAAIKWVSLPLVGWMAWRRWKAGSWGEAVLLLTIGLLPLALGWSWYLLAFEGTASPVPGEFLSKARSSELIPWLVTEIWPEALQRNGLFALAWAGAALLLIFFARSFVGMAENLFVCFLLLSPSNHAWYWTWLTPFAAVSRNRGTLLASAGAFVYFFLHHTRNTSGDWTQSGWERLVLWAPFLLGHFWTYFGPGRIRKDRPSHA